MTPVLLGDVNNDSKVNIADVAALIDYLVSDGTLPINEINADINGNGISISDVAALVDMLFSIE